MKKVSLILVAMLAFAGMAAGQSRPSLSHQLENEQIETIARARQFVVTIIAQQLRDEKGVALSGEALMKTRGTGSGSIISPDGKIITNKHVIDSSDLIRNTGLKPSLLFSYKVTLANKKVYDAELVQPPGDIDLAVLKIKNPPSDLKVATLGDSAILKQGSIVYAIGSPFGFSDTVTKGIVSNQDRNDPEMSKLHNFVQIDAAINPGNSGGPLINIDGEIVGVNTMIYSRSGQNSGLSFAIPSQVVKEFIHGVALKPKAAGWIGITVDAIDSQTRMMFGIDPSVEGVRIMTVDKRSPSFGKVQPGDIITDIDGEKILSQTEWNRLIMLKGEGTTIKINVIRNKKPFVLNIMLSKVQTP